MPLVVFELVLGVLVGPDVLGRAKDDQTVETLSRFGLAMLFFMAGYEIDFERLRGGHGRRGHALGPDPPAGGPEEHRRRGARRGTTGGRGMVRRGKVTMIRPLREPTVE